MLLTMLAGDETTCTIVCTEVTEVTTAVESSNSTSTTGTTPTRLDSYSVYSDANASLKLKRVF